jgi:hypothetical protein
LKALLVFACLAVTVKENFLGSGLQAHLRTHSREETLQLVTMFKVVYYVISVAITFENSFWGEALKLLTVFKVVYYVIRVASTVENSF